MRTRFPLAVVALMSVAACTDSNLTSPAADGLNSGPSLAIVDADNGGAVDGFWFLPPLANQVTTEGVLDEGLAPSMYVCELAGNPSAIAPGGDPSVECVTPSVIVTQFAAGTASITPGSNYQFSWDTSPGAAGNDEAMLPEKFYRIHIQLQDTVVGWLDVNPQVPSGQVPSGQSPGEDYADLYAFRLGETLPVKFFLSVQARCALVEAGYVIQCAAQGVIDANGGLVTLPPTEENPDWPTISVVVPPDALPAGYPTVILTMERIDPDVYASPPPVGTGEECIPGLAGFGFDAPQFGDCLRVTSDPDLPEGLQPGAFAIIEVCLDFGAVPILNPLGDVEQDERPQIIRYTNGITQGLPNVPAETCPVEPEPTAGFFPVPQEDGFFRTAAATANTIARWLGPEPLVAHESKIGFGGSSSGFSNFRWALPGEMLKEAGDNTILQQPETGTVSPDFYDVPVQVKVVDAGNKPVYTATVHFAPATGINGTTDVTEDESGTDGLADALWTLPGAPGTYTLEASAFGNFDEPVPDHTTLIDFDVRTIEFTATVVGGPAAAGVVPASGTEFDGLPGETLTQPFTLTITDVNGQPVVGYTVTWDLLCSADPLLCDGFVGSDTDGDPTNDDGSQFVTDENGQVTGYWTLANTPGSNTLTVAIGDLSYSWTASTGCQVTVDGNLSTVPGEWDCAVETGDTIQFMANISGGDAPAEVRWQTDAANIYFLVLIEQSELNKTNSLRIDFDNTGDGASADDDAIGYDAGADPGEEFFDEYLTSRCVNRSQSGCGSLDTIDQDGAGVLGNDGTYTVYELSHPLNGDVDEDIRVDDLMTGEELGFYLSLSIGKGAQGNTQVPDFRVFRTIISG